jgi:hypothetical protein
MFNLTPIIHATRVNFPPRAGRIFDELSTHTIELGPFLFKGARVVRFHEDGALRLHLPGHGFGDRVYVKDKVLRDALLNAALAALSSAGSPLATAFVSETSEQ